MKDFIAGILGAILLLGALSFGYDIGKDATIATMKEAAAVCRTADRTSHVDRRDWDPITCVVHDTETGEDLP